MAELIMLKIQRWLYERGNYQIIVENAWGNNGRYSQERISVNGERVRDRIEVRQSLFFWATVFEDSILNKTGELDLKVQWKSGLMTCKSRLLIDEERQVWTDYLSINWLGPICLIYEMLIGFMKKRQERHFIAARPSQHMINFDRLLLMGL